MKRLAWFWIFIAQVAFAQFVPHAPARSAFCLNPSGAWIAIATAQTASTLPNGAPATDLYALNGTAWYGLACNASGVLYADAQSIQGVTIPTLATGVLTYNSGTGLLSWGAGGSSGTVTTSGSPVSGNIAAFSSATAITAATAAQIVAAISTTAVANATAATTAANLSGTPTLPTGTAAATGSPSAGGTNVATQAYVATPGAIAPTSVTIHSDGVHAQQLSLLGQTTAPAVVANTAGWTAPASASFTAYTLQFPATNPAANQIMAVGAPVSGTAPVTYVSQIPATAVPAPTSTASSGSIAAVTTNNTYIDCTTTCNVTPLQAAAGVQLCVRNAPGSSTVITLNALGASNYYELTTHAGWGTANHNVVSGGLATDSICLKGYDATHYEVMSYTGTWTD